MNSDRNEELKAKYKTRLSSRNASSVSDKMLYPEFCFAASQDEKIFENFRRNPVYTPVLEHLSEKQGKKYLRVIMGNKNQKISEAEWEYIQKNDMFGNPHIYEYTINGNVKRLSPTTLRYVKVLLDIKDLFDFDKIKQIVEIGVGYGGQCRILCRGGRYITLVDLPEVLELVKKYLNGFQDKDDKHVSYIDGTGEFEEFSSDLVISNYAFSELIRNVQDMYLEKIIKKSKRGYITWNSLSYKQMGGYSVKELLKKLPEGAKVIKEKPLTARGNCIIVWGLKTRQDK